MFTQGYRADNGDSVGIWFYTKSIYSDDSVNLKNEKVVVSPEITKLISSENKREESNLCRATRKRNR